MRAFRFAWVAVLCTGSLTKTGLTAQEINCTTGLGSIEVGGNLNVTAACRLTGTEVRGNVTIFSGGSLIARGARIFGNVEGSRGDFVDIDDSAINGNLRLEEFVGDQSRIQGSDIRGNATLTGNRSRLEILNNDLDGGLRASGNRGGVLISGNSFGGSLECSGNAPPPTGLGNRVDGNTAGQCVNMESRTPQTSTPTPSPPPTPTTTPTVSPPVTSSPPPSTATRPTESTPPPTESPPPPTESPPPTSSLPGSPPPSPPSTTDATLEDEGGAGAVGWWMALVLALLKRRPFDRSRLRMPPSAYLRRAAGNSGSFYRS